MGFTKCSTWCMGSKNCKRRKKRACECGTFAISAPAAEDACIKAYANSGVYDSLDEWAADNGELIFNKLLVPLAGFDPNDSIAFQQRQNADAQNQRSETQKKLFLALIGLGLVAGIIYLVGSLISNK